MADHILSWMTFFPVIGAIVITFIPKGNKEIVKTVAAAAAAGQDLGCYSIVRSEAETRPKG